MERAIGAPRPVTNTRRLQNKLKKKVRRRSITQTKVYKIQVTLNIFIIIITIIAHIST